MKRLKKNLMIGITAAATAMASSGCARIGSPTSARAEKFLRGISAAVAESRLRAQDNKNQDVYGPPQAVNETSSGESRLESSIVEKIGFVSSLTDVAFDDSDFIMREPQLLYGPPEIFGETESEIPEPVKPVEPESGTEAEPAEIPTEPETSAPAPETSSEEKQTEPASAPEDGNGSETVQTEIAVFDAPQLLYGPPSASGPESEAPAETPESGEASSNPSPDAK